MFRRPPDPHEEALMILKGQKTQLAVVPGTQVKSGLGTPQGWRPQEPAALSAWPQASPPWPAYCPLSVLFVVGQVSREAVAMVKPVKPVTSVPRPCVGPTPGEDRSAERATGVQVSE